MSSNHSLDALNDNVLLSQFGDLVPQAHEGNALLLRHIDVIDRRKLWAKLGYSSLFNFLVGRYHMSESTAGKRMGAARAARRPTPLSPGRYKLTVTISEATHSKLEQLKDLLAHEIPKGDLGVILDRALDALLTDVHKQKTGIGAEPRSAGVTKPMPNGQQTRHVKASARREVWPRDQGRCGFVGEDGHRCNETRGLHFASWPTSASSNR